MTEFHIMKERFTQEDIQMIDKRIRPFLDGWRVEEWYKKRKEGGNYENVLVNIPGTWNAEIYPYKYFLDIKQLGDPNYGEYENEIQCYLSVGWRGFDDEIIIILEIMGPDVQSESSTKVSAEISKTGGSDMKLYFKDKGMEKLVTDFTRRGFFKVDKVDKVYIPDMRAFLSPQK